MWPLSSSKKEEPTATTRQDRQLCWENRDKYFACLDAANVVKPGTEPAKTCTKENASYEENCAKSWVRIYILLPLYHLTFCAQIEYFNQRRVIGEAQKERLARAARQNS